MADTVKARAKRYALTLARRRAGTAWGKMKINERMALARVTPQLLALARINLAREAERPKFSECIGLAGMLCKPEVQA